MKARSYVHVGFKKKILSALIYTVDTICEITCNGIFFIIIVFHKFIGVFSAVMYIHRQSAYLLGRQKHVCINTLVNYRLYM